MLTQYSNKKKKVKIQRQLIYIQYMFLWKSDSFRSH